MVEGWVKTFSTVGVWVVSWGPFSGVQAVSSRAAVHFQNLSLAAVFDQKVHRGFRRLEAHGFALGMVRALVRETIAATEVAVVTDMNTQRLDFVTLHGIGFHLFLKEQALFLQTLHVGEDFSDLLVRDIADIDGLSFLLGFEIVGGGLVAFVQTAAPYVVDVVFVVIVEYVNHVFTHSRQTP